MDYLIACARDLVCGRRYARQSASSWRAPTKETQKRSLVDKSIRLSIGLGVPINTTHYLPPLNLRR